MPNRTEIQAQPGRQDLLISREFSASRDRVFAAHCEPALISQWLGPKRYKTEIHTYQARTFGRYHFTHVSPQGDRHVFNGVFHFVEAPNLMIRTFEYEGLPERGHVSLETIRFEALGTAVSRVLTHCVFQSEQDRDQILAAGMDGGVRDSFDRLDALLARADPSGSHET